MKLRTYDTQNAISSEFAWVNAPTRTTMRAVTKTGVFSTSYQGSANDVLIRDDRYTDATAFKTAMNGVQLCYELATPITIQLTPNQINSLYGQNNIWADSGDTEVEYRADTKAWIQRKIAEAIASLT